MADDTSSPTAQPIVSSGSLNSSHNTGGSANRRPNSQPQHNWNSNNRRQRSTPRQYEGKIEELKHHIYDVSSMKSGSDMFSVTTHEIVEYIARSVKGAGEFITAMDPDNLSFDNLPNPPDAPPAATASMAEQEIWKLQL